MIPSATRYRSSVDAYATAILADTPLAYWRLGDSGTTAIDSSGNSHNGTYTSTTVNQASLLPNGLGHSALFNGTSSNVDIPAASVLNSMTAPLSIECWVKPSSLALSIIYGGGNAGVQLAMSSSGSSGKPYFGRGSVSNAPDATVALSTGSVFHVVVTVDSLGNVRYYVNNVAAGGPFSYGTSFPGSGDQRIGVYASGTLTYWWNGSIQEVAVYNYALTATQVANHYHAGGGTP